MEKKKIRFNAVDLIIVIAVLAIVAALVVRQFSIGGNNLKLNGDGANVKLEIEVKVSGIQEESQNFISIGDVANDSKGHPFAKVTKLNFLDAESYYVTESGEIKKLTVPTKIDAYVTVECIGTISDEGVFLPNGAQIALAQQIGLYLPKLSISGTIIDVSYNEISPEAFEAFETELSSAEPVFKPFNSQNGGESSDGTQGV